MGTLDPGRLSSKGKAQDSMFWCKGGWNHKNQNLSIKPLTTQLAQFSNKKPMMKWPMSDVCHCYYSGSKSVGKIYLTQDKNFFFGPYQMMIGDEDRWSSLPCTMRVNLASRSRKVLLAPLWSSGRTVERALEANSPSLYPSTTFLPFLFAKSSHTLKIATWKQMEQWGNTALLLQKAEPLSAYWVVYIRWSWQEFES